jgi:hypothetical protein
VGDFLVDEGGLASLDFDFCGFRVRTGEGVGCFWGVGVRRGRVVEVELVEGRMVGVVVGEGGVEVLDKFELGVGSGLFGLFLE